MLTKKKSILVGLMTVVALSLFVLVPVASAVEVEMWAHTDWYTGIGPIFLESVERFNVENPDIKVTLNDIPQGGYEKYATALAAGTGPQLLPSGGVVDQFAMEGYLEPLTSVFSEEWINEFFPGPLDKLVLADGNIYCFNMGGMPMGLFYNKTHFAEAGITDAAVPRTWDQLVEVGKKLAQFDSNGNMTREGLAMTGIVQHVVENLVLELGGYKYTDEVGTATMFDSDAWIEATQIVYDMIYKDKITSLEFPVFIESWLSQLGSMSWISTFMGGHTDAVAPEISWGILPGPLPPKSQMPEPWSFGIGDPSYGLIVLKDDNAERREATFKLMRHLLDDDEFMVARIKHLSVFPVKTDLITNPVFSTPDMRAIGLNAKYSIIRGECVVEVAYVLQPKAMDMIFLNHAPIKETLEQLKVDSDKYLKDTGVVRRITERTYQATAADVSALEDWRSGKTKFPLQ